MEDNNFRVERKEYGHITLRIDKKVIESFDILSTKSNISRNQLIESGLKYALKHLDFIDDEREDSEDSQNQLGKDE